MKRQQDWTPGQTVRVGFLTLYVTGKERPEDRENTYLPCMYTLEDGHGRKYTFTPHHGLVRGELSATRRRRTR